MVDPVLFRVLYGAGLRVSEALSLTLADVDTRSGTLRIRDSKNGESRTVPVTGRLTATLEGYIAAAHPAPETSDYVFYSVAAGRPINQSTVYLRFRGYLADAGIPHFTGGPHPHSLRHGFAVANLRRWAAARRGPGRDAALPGVLHGPRRPSRHPVLPEADRGRLPRGDGQGPGPVRLRHPRAARGRAVSPRPAPPPDLAGRWLSKFFTGHLAGERAASPKTVSSYRDAMKLLLTWFRDAERIPPEKLRLADIDRPRVLRFLDWLEAERGCSAATRNQRLAVIKSFCRYTAVEQPDHLDQVTQVLAIRQKNTPAPQLDHLTGDEVKALLAEPGTASARAVRDTVLLALAYDTAARVQELCDLDVADIRRGSPMTVVIRGKGSKIRYVPVMDPTARLVADYLDHRDRHPGVGADADPLFTGPNHSRLTRSGMAKLLARHVRAVRARDPGWAPGLPVTPHTLRRSRAMHLVQAGVNLIYIRDLLGHADVSTTEIYARADAEAKRKAIENAYEPLTPDALPDWTSDSSLIGWLDSLGR